MVDLEFSWDKHLNSTDNMKLSSSVILKENIQCIEGKTICLDLNFPKSKWLRKTSVINYNALCFQNRKF
jgi:hypothetical protein